MNYRGLNIPFVSFGAVTSDDLFCEKEQAIFDFYEKNKNRYRRAVDIGANIGVHTILMARCDWEVNAYEPDPVHYRHLIDNLREHSIRKQFRHYVVHEMAAVSDHDGYEIFVRVKGNTTGSHLKGDKQPYGELEEFKVRAVDCRPIFAWADFAKIDCEGHEARLLNTVTEDCHCDFMVEIGNRDNALAIWEHFWPLTYKLYSQKRDWAECRHLGDVPAHHSEGSLFIGRKPPFA